MRVRRPRSHRDSGGRSMAEVRTHSRGRPSGMGLESTAAMHVMRNSIAILGSWMALLAVSLSHGLAAEMFEGKTITISAAGTPGGGYDAYARLLARHLGKHLPGTACGCRQERTRRRRASAREP